MRPARQAAFEAALPRLSFDPPDAPESFDPRTLFEPSPDTVEFEIGFGGGEHLLARAEASPGTGFLGAEPFVDGMARLVAEVERRGLRNVRVHQGDAFLVLEALREASLSRIHLLFPDPWPKTRHHKRRFVQVDSVAQCARVLAPGGLLTVATDHMGYARWALAHLVRAPAFEWLAQSPSDWREPPPEWSPTRYERKALAMGARPVYLRFRRVVA